MMMGKTSTGRASAAMDLLSSVSPGSVRGSRDSKDSKEMRQSPGLRLSNALDSSSDPLSRLTPLSLADQSSPGMRPTAVPEPGSDNLSRLTPLAMSDSDCDSEFAIQKSVNEETISEFPFALPLPEDEEHFTF